MLGQKRIIPEVEEVKQKIMAKLHATQIGSVTKQSLKATASSRSPLTPDLRRGRRMRQVRVKGGKLVMSWEEGGEPNRRANVAQQFGISASASTVADHMNWFQSFINFFSSTDTSCGQEPFAGQR